jgi:hypothetical protein
MGSQFIPCQPLGCHRYQMDLHRLKLYQHLSNMDSNLEQIDHNTVYQYIIQYIIISIHQHRSGTPKRSSRKWEKNRKWESMRLHGGVELNCKVQSISQIETQLTNIAPSTLCQKWGP